MSFAKTIFQKDIYSITLADVENFFSIDQEENAILEFKSGGVEIEGICREVCAFLNSEGGLLIIGSPREKIINGKKIFNGALAPSKISNKDTLTRSIGSNISPSPHGIKVQSISHEYGNIYILDIPQSLTPPHQLNRTGTYYIRLEAEAKPAPHGIVEALFFRRQNPLLVFGLKITRAIDHPGKHLIDLRFANEAVFTADDLGYILYVHGINEFEYFDKGWKKKVVRNGYIKLNGDIPANGLLVKGVSFDSGYMIKPNHKLILIDILYWCRDIEAKRYVAIYDLPHDSRIVKSYRSGMNEGSVDDIYNLYISHNPLHRNLVKSDDFSME